MVITIKTNVDNKNYLNISRIDLISLFLRDGSAVPENIIEEADIIYNKLYNFENHFNLGMICGITIPKDSLLGEFLLTTDDIKIFNDDEYISNEKVFNAYTIATYEENPISVILHSMYKNKVCGFYNDLTENIKEDVLDYILDNSDFLSFLEHETNTYEPSSYFVYENGLVFYKKIDEKEYVKVK